MDTNDPISGETIQNDADSQAVETNEANVEQAEQNEETVKQSVPLSALQSERAKRQQLEEDLKMIKEHLALSQVKQPQPTQKDDFEGLEDGDVMTVGEFKKLSGNLANQFKMTIEELKMAQKHPDYQEVITKYLPDVLKQNPSLQQTLQKTQDYELAYYLAKNSESYKSENKKTKKSVEAQRIVENAQKAGSLASMGATSPISQAKRYKDMSDDEFMQEVRKNLG